jgi:hypothetical protein
MHASVPFLGSIWARTLSAVLSVPDQGTAFPTPPKIRDRSNYVKTNLDDAGRLARSLCSTLGNPELSADTGDPRGGGPTPIGPADIPPGPMGLSHASVG